VQIARGRETCWREEGGEPKMTRVKRSIHARKKRRSVLARAKGYRGEKHSSYKRAKEQVMRSGAYAYRDRRNRKRDFRSLWIVRINAAARREGLSYSRLMSGLRESGIDVNRKMLADIAVRDPEAFSRLAERAKQAREVTAAGS
jgi:large subunit ribosomal protein L20